MNTPVLVDWLTLLLAPVGVILLAVGFFAHRSAARAGTPAPGWGKAAQGVGIAVVMLIALIRLLWGS